MNRVPASPSPCSCGSARKGAIGAIGAVLAAALVPAAWGADAARQQAASAVATGAPECRALGDFYWEIGNAAGAQGSGAVGKTTAGEKLRIASASKFVFGAYVIEKVGAPSAEQLAFLEMKAGYASFNPLLCGFSRSVDGCGAMRSNGVLDAAKVGQFSYGGGHDQKLASLLGLGALNAKALTAEVTGKLGGGLGFSYASPQLAGGMESSAADFAAFLRRVIGGPLKFKQYLGYAPVAAAPGASGVADTPVRENWHYSVNHWIEDDPATGDGSFSSPGALGFYPWISRDKTTYGVLARSALSKNAYWESVLCGRQIRKAWMAAK